MYYFVFVWIFLSVKMPHCAAIIPYIYVKKTKSIFHITFDLQIFVVIKFNISIPASFLKKNSIHIIPPADSSFLRR